jgi:hypothetical protein
MSRGFQQSLLIPKSGQKTAAFRSCTVVIRPLLADMRSLVDGSSYPSKGVRHSQLVAQSTRKGGTPRLAAPDTVGLGARDVRYDQFQFLELRTYLGVRVRIPRLVAVPILDFSKKSPRICFLENIIPGPLFWGLNTQPHHHSIVYQTQWEISG